MNNHSLSTVSSYQYVATKLEENNQLDSLELPDTFLKELRHYRAVLNEVFGMTSPQQKQLCFLAEALLGAALYYKASDLQNVLKDMIYASSREEAGISLLNKVNGEIDVLLAEKH
jgi:hypothetical protein